ncbi:hypothetical protein HFO55_11090 [Rhizobium leguminosarum]|nr:hypothetical protein [Rhizobium leguminosarum]
MSEETPIAPWRTASNADPESSTDTKADRLRPDCAPSGDYTEGGEMMGKLMDV